MTFPRRVAFPNKHPSIVVARYTQSRKAVTSDDNFQKVPVFGCRHTVLLHSVTGLPVPLSCTGREVSAIVKYVVVVFRYVISSLNKTILYDGRWAFRRLVNQFTKICDKNVQLLLGGMGKLLWVGLGFQVVQL